MTEEEKKDFELSQKLIQMKEKGYNDAITAQEKVERKILLSGLGIIAAIVTAAGAIAFNQLKEKIEDKAPSEPVKIQQQAGKTVYQKSEHAR